MQAVSRVRGWGNDSRATRAHRNMPYTRNPFSSLRATARPRRHAVAHAEPPAPAVPGPRFYRRRGEAGRRQVRDLDLRVVELTIRGRSLTRRPGYPPER